MTNKQINIEGIEPVDHLSYVPVSDRYRSVQIAYAVIVYVLMGATALLLLLADTPWWCVGAETLIVISCVTNLMILRKAYRFKGYAMREHDISYRSGVIFPKVTTIPFSRIQQVSLNQNPVSRYFALSSVIIVNGAQGLSSLTIPGLHKEDAERIKAIITEKINDEND